MKENSAKTNFVAVVEPDYEVFMDIEKAKELLEQGLTFIKNAKNLPGSERDRWRFRIGITVNKNGICEICAFGVATRDNG